MLRALVISGGGSRGAFAVGALQYLKNQYPDLSFDIFVGTSTGSLIVPLFALDHLDLLIKLYTSVHTDDIVTGGEIANLAREISLFDASPLGNLIETYYNDNICTQLLNSDKQVFICTTCLQTCNTVVFTTKNPVDSAINMIQVNGNTQFRKAILASANQPVFMQPVQVLGQTNPPQQFVDGGIREVLGIQVAIDAGADEIIAISLSEPHAENDGKLYDNAVDILFKTLDVYSVDVTTNNINMPLHYTQALAYINKVKSNMKTAGLSQQDIDRYFNVPMFPQYQRTPITIHLIQPQTTLGGGAGGLQFNPVEMEAMMKNGSDRMQQYIAGLPGGISTFT